MTAMQALKQELASRLQRHAPASLMPAQLLDLAACHGPLLPTLNGLLLGYPVVYMVDASIVDHAAAYLSNQPLRLCTLQGHLETGTQYDMQVHDTFLAWSVPDNRWSDMAHGVDSCIQSFIAESASFDLLHGALVYEGWQAKLITDQTVRL